MSELENKQDPTEVTPVDSTTPSDVAQPATAELDPTAKMKELETKLQEMESKAKRYKEQLIGREKQVEELKLKALVAGTQPTPEVAPVVEEVKPVVIPQHVQPQDIAHAVYINKAILKDEFGDDEVVPFNKDTATKVEEVLNKLDPTGRTKYSVDAWRSAYKIYRGDIAQDVIKQREEALRAELQKKEVVKAASHVEPVTPPVVVKAGPTLDDVIAGKVKMTTKEMLVAFPELRSQVTKKYLKDIGLE